jgi:chromate transporter
MTMREGDAPDADRTKQGGRFEVLTALLRLGLTSFGGPVAYLCYCRDEFVTRRRWLDDRGYADLVVPCQFPPWPAPRPGA